MREILSLDAKALISGRARSRWMDGGLWDTASAGSGTTKRVTGPEIEDHWDSNGAIASAGSTTLNVNNGSTYSYGYIMVALQPSVPSTGVTGRLMMMGMGR